MWDDRDWLHMLWAANAWEKETGSIDECGERNLHKLARHPALNATAAASFGEELSLRIDRYLRSGLTLATFLDRITAVIQQFQLMGYNEWMAGHEGAIRELIWRTAGKSWGADLDDACIEQDEKVGLLIAYYLAFTDWIVSTESIIPSETTDEFLARIRADGKEENLKNEELFEENSARLSSEDLVSLMDDTGLNLGLRHAVYRRLWDRQDLPDDRVLSISRRYLDGLLVLLRVGRMGGRGFYPSSAEFSISIAYRLSSCEKRTADDERRVLSVFRYCNPSDDPDPMKIRRWLEGAVTLGGLVPMPLRRIGA